MGDVEYVAPPVLALDDHAGPCRVDRDHLGGLSVEPVGAVVVAGELHPIAGAELLLDLDKGRQSPNAFQKVKITIGRTSSLAKR